VLKGRISVNNKLGRIWEEVEVAYLGHYSKIFLEN
jgi:hypothetical protein